MEQIIAGELSLWDRLRALNADLRCPNELLLDVIRTGSPSDKMAAIITLKEDGLEIFLEHTDGIKIKALLDVLSLESEEAASGEDQLDWRSAVWELLLLILHYREALGPDERSVCIMAISPVLALVGNERDRRMALQFLLTEPNRSRACQDIIVESGGISLLVDVLRTERDDETLAMLLELLHNIAASSTSHVQEIDIVVQNIVDNSKPDELDFALLLLLVYHERLPPFEPSETAADRQDQLKLFTLQASVNILYLASSSALHKYIALNCVRKALPEIGFAFVFDHGGIPLLWDIIMQSESQEMTDIATEILRWLARENQAFRDHILDFYSQYAAVQEEVTKSKAASIRYQIIGGRNKRKRSDTDTSEDQIEQQAHTEETSVPIGTEESVIRATISGASTTPMFLDLNTDANDTGSDADSDCGEIVYSSSESDTEDLDPTSDMVQSPSNQTHSSDKEACACGNHCAVVSDDGSCQGATHEEHKSSSPATD